MRLEVEITKTRFFLILLSIAIVGSLVGVFAYNTGVGSDIIGHSLNEIQGFENCADGETVIKTADGWDCFEVLKQGDSLTSVSNLSTGVFLIGGSQGLQNKWTDWGINNGDFKVYPSSISSVFVLEGNLVKQDLSKYYMVQLEYGGYSNYNNTKQLGYCSVFPRNDTRYKTISGLNSNEGKAVVYCPDFLTFNNARASMTIHYLN